MNAISFTKGAAAKIFAAVALFSLIAGMIPTQAFAATNLFDNAFEIGSGNNYTFSGNGWTSADSGWSLTNGSGHLGSHKAQITDSSNTDKSLRKAVSTVGYSSISLNYYYKTNQPLESTDHVYVEWWNGSSWVQVADHKDISNGSWTQATWNLVGAGNLSSFAFRFRENGFDVPTHHNNDQDEFWLDAVTLSGTPIPPPDADNDTVPDSTDNCVNTPNTNQADTDTDGIGDACEADTDGDTVIDDVDNCDAVVNPTQTDTDNDGVGDACESAPDADADGVPDATDNCVNTPNADQADADDDNVGDVCEPDTDGDDVIDDLDNCPVDANANQADEDNDNIGDACDTPVDTDADDDGVNDDVDNCVNTPNADQVDTDTDGIGDACEEPVDTDSDGIPDSTDNCPVTPNADQADADDDSVGDVCEPDTDGDDVIDDLDNCPLVDNTDQVDTDDDGTGDACDTVPDTDADDDGVNDDVDNCVNTPNPSQEDNDRDGIGNVCDSTPDGDGGGDPDPIPGCTDKEANNYDSEATSDDKSCTYGYLSQCHVEAQNLLVNPSFEDSVGLTSGNWGIFTSVNGWAYSLSTGLELWNNMFAGASHGVQNAELDGEDATKITQTVNGLIPGAIYELSFDFAARGTDAADNHIEAMADGVSLVNQSTSNTSWLKYGATFTSDGSTDISFVDLGTVQEGPGGTGTLLDNAKLCLVRTPVDETDTLYRIQGYAWHDDNRNAEWDGYNDEDENTDEEGRLGGFTIRITNNDGDSRETTTDENGFYYFDVPAGTWVVTEVEEGQWFRTTQESFTVTVPALPPPMEVTFLDSIMNFIVPVAYAQAMVDTYGDYNFGNDERRAGGGGGGNNNDDEPDGEVLGDSDDADDTEEDTPEGAVLGEQVDAVPAGAPDAGAGGTSRGLEFFQIAPVAMMGRTRKHG